MPVSKCPGQDTRFWTDEDIFESPCPSCGEPVEFWKDDPRRRCISCGKEARNPKFDMGCAKWCRYAEECLGLAPELEGDTSLSDALIEELKGLFGEDQLRIRHALQVLDYAERILDAEGGDPLVVRAAAILHDIGIQEAERKHGSPAGNYQEVEGPPIARQILEKLAVTPEQTDHICRIVGSHHSARDIDTPEFRIIWDADWLVNLPEECSDSSAGELQSRIERIFRTGTGRSLARGLAARVRNSRGAVRAEAEHDRTDSGE